MDWFSFRLPFRDAAGEKPGAVDLYQHVAGRIDRALQGERWLRRRFTAVDELEVSPCVADIGRVEVVDVEVRRGSRKRVTVTAMVPMAWFDNRIDGLLGYRLTLMAFEAVDAVGARLDLGPCELRSQRQDRGADELPLFESPGEGGGEINRRIAAELAASQTMTWVITGPVAPELEPWCRTVTRLLDARRIDQPLPTPVAVPLDVQELIHVEVGPGHSRHLERNIRAAGDIVAYWLHQWGDFALSALPHPVRVVFVPAEEATSGKGSGSSIVIPVAVNDIGPGASTAILKSCLGHLIRMAESRPRRDSREVFTSAPRRDTEDLLHAGLDEVAVGELAVVTRLLPAEEGVGSDSYSQTLGWLERTLDGIADVGESHEREEFTYWIVTPSLRQARTNH